MLKREIVIEIEKLLKIINKNSVKLFGFLLSLFILTIVVRLSNYGIPIQIIDIEFILVIVEIIIFSFISFIGFLCFFFFIIPTIVFVIGICLYNIFLIILRRDIFKIKLFYIKSLNLIPYKDIKKYLISVLLILVGISALIEGLNTFRANFPPFIYINPIVDLVSSKIIEGKSIPSIECVEINGEKKKILLLGMNDNYVFYYPIHIIESILYKEIKRKIEGTTFVYPAIINKIELKDNSLYPANMITFLKSGRLNLYRHKFIQREHIRFSENYLTLQSIIKNKEDEK